MNEVDKLKLEVKTLRGVITQYEKSNRRINIKMPESNDILRFAIFSDTHYGSSFERVNEVKEFFKVADAEEYTIKLCAGDVLDGWRMYKGQEFEQHKRGFDEQSKWFYRQAPRGDVYYITGNHDSSYTKMSGLNVGEILSSNRPDWKCIGDSFATVILVTGSGKQFKIALMHPGGGTAYAISYKTQKIIEHWEGGNKPNLIALGHFHKAENLPMHRNVIGIQAGCFQSQTPFMASKYSSAQVGGWLVEVKLGKGCNRIKTEFVAFY